MEEIMDNPLYLYDLEYKNVIGVDEAGRGPLAGPVVAAAVILKEYTEELNEINDSKKLTEKKREKLYDIIMKNFDVAIGISTGGPPVLEKIFTNLKKDFSIPILVVQHMPPAFTKALAERLCKLSQRQVKEAEDGEKIENGVIYIAKGGVHMAVEKILGKYYIRLLENVENGKVFVKDDVVVWKCRNCGYVHVGKEAPKVCPTCKHPQSFFEIRAENY